MTAEVWLLRFILQSLDPMAKVSLGIAVIALVAIWRLQSATRRTRKSIRDKESCFRRYLRDYRAEAVATAYQYRQRLLDEFPHVNLEAIDTAEQSVRKANVELDHAIQDLRDRALPLIQARKINEALRRCSVGAWWSSIAYAALSVLSWYGVAAFSGEPPKWLQYSSAAALTTAFAVCITCIGLLGSKAFWNPIVSGGILDEGERYYEGSRGIPGAG
jgi:hypothetical protein